MPTIVRTKSSLALLLLVFILAGDLEAQGRVLVPGINAPPLPLPPPQQIQSPMAPQFGAAVQPSVTPLPQNSFSDRVSQCLQLGAAAGLTGRNLSAYSGECANQ